MNNIRNDSKNIKGVKFFNTPISESTIDYLSELTPEDTPLCLCGYISCVTVGEDSLTVYVEIAGGITVEAIFSTRAGENQQLHSFLEEFHCLLEDSVDFRHAFNYNAVDVWFKFNRECNVYYATKICTSTVHSTFSSEISTLKLQHLMYREYIRQEEQKKGGKRL